MIELKQLADLLNTGGLALITAALIVGGRQGWYFWGPSVAAMLKEKDAQIAEARADRDAWKALAKGSTGDATKMVEWASNLAREVRP